MKSLYESRTFRGLDSKHRDVLQAMYHLHSNDKRITIAGIERLMAKDVSFNHVMAIMTNLEGKLLKRSGKHYKLLLEDIGSESKNEKEIAEKLKDGYNKIEGVVKCRTLTPKREKIILARVKEHGEDKCKEMINLVANSPFLKGESTDFKVDIEWIFNVNNFVKIIEGKYTPKEEKRPEKSENPYLNLMTNDARKEYKAEDKRVT